MVRVVRIAQVIAVATKEKWWMTGRMIGTTGEGGGDTVIAAVGGAIVGGDIRRKGTVGWIDREVRGAMMAWRSIEPMDETITKPPYTEPENNTSYEF